MSIAVSIVEDDPQVRGSLAKLIDGAPGFRCVSVHPSAEDALVEIPKVKPEVVLMDINLPGANGVECVRKLKPHCPTTQIIMLTVHIARKIVQSFQQPAPACAEAESLSPREAEVLDLLAKGFLYKEIADQMKVSYATVHTHIRHIYEKLHVRSRTEAVAKHLGQSRSRRELAKSV
jgi:DNA-binding NarL/FixJ family response regulator